jgi:SulP family sulfate permease
MVPMACVAGVLLYVSTAMVKKEEVRLVRAGVPLDRWMMVFTAVMVPLTDFLTGVMSALVLHWLLKRLAVKNPFAKPVTE